MKLEPEIKTLKASDGSMLTYQRAGSGKEVIVLVNAPGMSIEFWSWMVRALHDDHVVIAFDYRGSIDAGSQAGDVELSLDDIVGDLTAILVNEAVTAAYFVSWGLGAKLAFEFYLRFPAKVLSLSPISMDEEVFHRNAKSRYTETVLSVGRQLDASPGSINVVTKTIRRIGAPSSINLFLTALRTDDLGPIVDLMDLLVLENSMSNLALHYLERPEGLVNFLKLYEVFSRFEVDVDFESIDVPVVIIEGECDGLAAIGAQVRNDLDSIPRLEWKTVEKASHFLPIEYPEKTASIIKYAIESHATLARTNERFAVCV